MNANLADPEGDRRGGGYCGGIGDGGTRGHFGALPPATDPLVSGRKYVEYATRGEGGAVPDGLYPGDGSPSLWKRLCSGP